MSEQDKEVEKEEENEIIIKCLKCGFEDKPENFNAVLTYDESNGQISQEIYIQCPVCETTIFGWYFPLKTRMVVSRLLFVTREEAKTPEEAQKVFYRKLVSLRKKYGINMEKDEFGRDKNDHYIT